MAHALKKFNCTNCKIDFFARRKTAQFCLKKCFYDYNKSEKHWNWGGGGHKEVKIKCVECGKIFIRRYRKCDPVANFCSQSCSQKDWWRKHPEERSEKSKIFKEQVGEKNPYWKGGRFVTRQGYVMILNRKHHRANSRGYVAEHILMAEKKYGRLIMRGEIVHHINKNRQDNSMDNLIVFSSHVDHMKHHDEEKLSDEKGKFKN